MSDINYQNMPTKVLISKLIDAELKVDLELAKEIRNRGSEAVPHLLTIFKEDEYWIWGGPGDGWAPVHALHLLSAIRTPESLHALIDVVRNYEEKLGEWLTESVPSLLSYFDLLAVDSLKKLILDTSLNSFVRLVAGQALNVLAHHHPELRGMVIGTFRKVIQKDTDEVLISLLIDDLAQFKDPDALEDIKAAFDKNLVDESIINFKDVKRIYETPDDKLEYHRHEKDPMSHFSSDNIDYLWKINYPQKIPSKPLQEKKERPPIKTKKKKIGRNEPCPCGSGKKYKKCCLMKEIQQKAKEIQQKEAKRKEEQAKKEMWERFWNNFENASYSGKLSIFRDYLRSADPQADVVFDILSTLLEEIRKRGDYEAFTMLVERVKAEQPELYAKDAAFYSLFLVENMALAGEFKDLSSVLEPFVENPNNIDEFFKAIELLMYHSQREPLIQVMQRAYPKVMESLEILYYGKEEFSNILGWLILFRGEEAHVSLEEIHSEISEYWEVDRDYLRELIAWLRGGLYKLSREDFLKGYSKQDEVERKIFDLTVEFIGWLKSRGMGYPRALLARMSLIDYLINKARRSKVRRGGHLLLPDKASLDAHLAGYLHLLNYLPYRVASLTEALPNYYSYLFYKGLIDEEELKEIENMASLKGDVLKYFTSRCRDEEIIRAIDRSWKD